MKKSEILGSLEEKSEEFDILMSEPPRLYLRSGFGMIFVFLLLTGIASYFIDYPDYLSAEVKIVSSTPRAPIISNVNGRIFSLKKNNSLVKKNEIIGVIENIAKVDDVLLLEKIIKNNNSIKFNDSLNKNFELGEIQSSFTRFLTARNELNIYTDINLNKTKLSNYKGELTLNLNLINSLEEEKKHLNEKKDLSESQLKRAESMFKKKLISQNELEISKQKNIDIKNQFQSKVSYINQIKINTQKTNSTLNLTLKEMEEMSLRLYSNYKNTLEQLKSDIKMWKRQFLLISPIDGTFILNNIWASQQITKTGDEIGSIVPKNEQIYAIAKLPEFRSGKVKPKSDAFLYLNGYNYSEYGIIKGKVKSISPVPYEGFYNVEIQLQNQLITDSKFEIVFTPELSGEIKIITEDMNLFERLFIKIKKLFNRKRTQNPTNENS